MQWMRDAVSQLVGQYASEPLQQKGMLSKVRSTVAPRCCARTVKRLTVNFRIAQEQLTKFFIASTELLETAGWCVLMNQPATVSANSSRC